MTALTRLASLLGLFDTIPFSNRNYIVDGNFDSWITPGGVSLGANAYSNNVTPMYNHYTGAGGAATVARGGPFAPGGEPLGLTSPMIYGLTHNQTTAATTPPQLYQNIESVRTLQGRSATFSCWLWTASGTATITSIQFAQNFGTGGSPSATNYIGVNVNWAITTAPKRFSVRADIPLISGKTLGTNGNDYLGTSIILPTNTTFNITTCQWQLEQSSKNSSSDINGNGGAPTAFEYRGMQTEAARVMRYYEIDTQPFQYCDVTPAGSSTNYGCVRYAVPKRSVPAIAVGVAWAYYSTGTNTPFTPTFGAQLDQVQFTASGLTNWRGWCGSGTLVADARL